MEYSAVSSITTNSPGDQLMPSAQREAAAWRVNHNESGETAMNRKNGSA
jgi:hypothetical protein